jgi:hypothetical protein
VRERGVLPAYLALVAGIVCIAWSAIFVRWTDIPGLASAFYRMLIPAVVLLPTFLFERGGTRLNGRMLWVIALGGLFFALDLALYNTSILKTTAANATLLGNNTPIVVGLLSAYGLNELLGNQYFTGRAGYLRKVFTLPSFVGKQVYLVGYGEVGKMYGDPLPAPRVSGDGAAGLLAETSFGPVFVGGSAGDTGHQKWFFQLGRVF